MPPLNNKTTTAPVDLPANHITPASSASGQSPALQDKNKIASPPSESTPNSIKSLESINQKQDPLAAQKANNDSDSTTNLKAIYLPIALLFVGGYLNHRLTLRRDIRKECRTEVDACCKMLADLLEKGRKYFKSEPNSDDAVKLAPEIRFEIYRLIKRVERLESRHAGFSTENAIDQLHEKLTGGDFDSANKPIIESNSMVFREIELSIHGLIDTLEDGFSKTFDGWNIKNPFKRRNRTIQ